MKQLSITVLGLSIILSSCTTSITSKKIASDFIENNNLRSNNIYYLKEGQINTSTTYNIKNCLIPGYEADQIELEDVLELETTISFTSKSSSNHAYELNSENIKSKTKSTEFEIQYYNDQSIKSINSKAEDKIVDTAAQVIKFAAGIVTAGQFETLSSIYSKGAAFNDDGDIIEQSINVINLCKDDVEIAVVRKNEIDNLNLEVRQMQATLTAMLQAHGAITKDNPATQEISALQSEIIAMHKKIRPLNLSHLKSKKETNFTINKRSGFGNFEILPSDKVLNKFFSPDGMNILKPLIKQYVRVSPDNINTINSSTPSCANSEKGCNGIIYKQPVLASITVCTSTPLQNHSEAPPQKETQSVTCKSQNDNILKFHEGFFAGVGLASVLEYKNGPFEDNTFLVNFTPDGLLEKYKYTDAEVMSSQLTPAVELINEYNNLDAKKSAKIKAVAEDSANYAKIIDSMKKLSVDPEILNEIEKLTAQKSLNTLRKEVDAQQSTVGD